MKASIIILLLSCTTTILFGQTDIRINSSRYFTLCKTSSFTLTSKDYDLKNLRVCSDNGLVTTLAFGVYELRALRPGETNIFIIRKDSSRDTIKRFQYEVKRMPLPIAQFAGISSGTLKHSKITMQAGIKVPINCCDIQGEYSVQKYRVIVKRKGNNIFEKKLMSSYFSIDVQDQLRLLENGDVLVFDDISVRDCDYEMRILKPLEFVVTEAQRFEPLTSQSTSLDTIETIDPFTGEITMQIIRRLKK